MTEYRVLLVLQKREGDEGSWRTDDDCFLGGYEDRKRGIRFYDLMRATASWVETILEGL